jgi:replicative DNA helicase
MLSASTGAAYTDIRSGRLSEAAFMGVVSGARPVAELPVQVVQPHIRDTASIYAAVKQCISKFHRMEIETGAVLIDYLQQVRAPGKGRYEQVTEVAIWAKGMAMRLDVPVIGLAQLSREYAKRDPRRPMLQDLKDSGQIEQEADTVLLCHREDYFLEREKPDSKHLEKMADWSAALGACKDTMEVHVAKNRAGPIRTVVIGADMTTNRFWDFKPQEQESML